MADSDNANSAAQLAYWKKLGSRRLSILIGGIPARFTAIFPWKPSMSFGDDKLTRIASAFGHPRSKTRLSAPHNIPDIQIGGGQP